MNNKLFQSMVTLVFAVGITAVILNNYDMTQLGFSMYGSSLVFHLLTLLFMSLEMINIIWPISYKRLGAVEVTEYIRLMGFLAVIALNSVIFYKGQILFLMKYDYTTSQIREKAIEATVFIILARLAVGAFFVLFRTNIWERSDD